MASFSIPVAEHGLSGVTQITACDSHTCAIVAGGEVRCWGYNTCGQLGNGPERNFAIPVPEIGLSVV